MWGKDMHKLDTDQFQLEFKTKIFESDMVYPVNTTLTVNVCSFDFSAMTTMDIDIRKFADFTKSLQELYQTLSGKVRLEEPYGKHSYIEFSGKTDGYIKVKGRLYSNHQYGASQELYFENEFDQTYLQCFANELFSNYKKYLAK